MENTILTVREFLKTSGDKFVHSDGFEEAMIEFAKLHVTEALKTVAKKAIEMNQWENEKISKNAIIKSYDLNNIK